MLSLICNVHLALATCPSDCFQAFEQNLEKVVFQGIALERFDSLLVFRICEMNCNCICYYSCNILYYVTACLQTKTLQTDRKQPEKEGRHKSRYKTALNNILCFTILTWNYRIKTFFTGALFFSCFPCVCVSGLLEFSIKSRICIK